LTENFVETPVMVHEAQDYKWLAHKHEHEVTTVGYPSAANGK
jgi:cytochrome c oxidase subunit 1